MTTATLPRSALDQLRDALDQSLARRKAIVQKQHDAEAEGANLWAAFCAERDPQRKRSLERQRKDCKSRWDLLGQDITSLDTEIQQLKRQLVERERLTLPDEGQPPELVGECELQRREAAERVAQANVARGAAALRETYATLATLKSDRVSIQAGTSVTTLQSDAARCAAIDQQLKLLAGVIETQQGDVVDAEKALKAAQLAVAPVRQQAAALLLRVRKRLAARPGKVTERDALAKAHVQKDAEIAADDRQNAIDRQEVVRLVGREDDALVLQSEQRIDDTRAADDDQRDVRVARSTALRDAGSTQKSSEPTDLGPTLRRVDALGQVLAGAVRRVRGN